MPARNVRNNNPVNLRAPSVAQAKAWGWPGVVGIDERGFIQFATAADGKAAADQQFRVNSKQFGPEGTVADSLGKHVSGDDNPANALGIFTKQGMDPSTLLSNIDSDDYNRILALSEGGADAYANIGQGGGPDRFPQAAPRDSAGLDNNISAVRPAWANSAPPSIEELFAGIADSQPDGQGVGDVGVTGTPDRLQVGASVTGRAIPNSQDISSSAIDPLMGIPQAIKKNINSNRRAGSSPVIGGEATGDTQSPLQFPSQMYPQDPQMGPQPKFPSQMYPQQGAQTPDILQPIPQGADVDITGSGEGGNILKTLGGILGSNAGLSALGLGAQGIGSLLEGRAQSKADKRTSKQQKVNNAIAAFTGGNAAQAASERGSSTGGGILKALGQGLGGFAQVRASEDQAEAELQQSRDHDDTLLDIARIQQGGASTKSAEKLAAEQAEAEASFGIVEDTMETLLEVHKGGGISTGGLAINLPSWAGGDVQTFMESAGGMLLGKMNEIYTLGRLSDKDIQILQTSIPRWDEGVADVEAKLAAVRMLIDIRRKQYANGITNLNTAAAETPPGIYEAISGVKGAGGSGSLDNSSAEDFL